MSATLTKPRPKKISGVVDTCVHHPSGKFTGKPTATGFAPSKMIKCIQDGLPIEELDALQTSLDVPMETLATKLGISKATLHRRKLEGRLDPVESDRVVRFARLMGQTVKVFGSEAEGRDWLNTPQFGLGGAVPLDYAETEIGAREVENLLGRIEYGVYS